MGYVVIRRPNYPYDDLRRYFRADQFLVVLDIGAYRGTFSKEFLRNFQNSKIYAFEPQKVEFEEMKSILSNYQNIVTINAAVYDKPGKQKLFKTKVAHSSSLLLSNEKYYESQKNIGFELVDSIVLDNWLEENNLDDIDFLKLDTQGAELTILKNIREKLQRIKSIFIELNFKEQYLGSTNFTEVYNFLLENDFDLVNLYNLSHINGKLIFCDGLFVNKRLLS